MSDKNTPGAALGKISLPINRWVDSRSKDCAACSMGRKTEAAEVEDSFKRVRGAETDGNVSSSEEIETAEIRLEYHVPSQYIYIEVIN